ncbi:hypothetical protein DFH06DRAFT_1298954 [Mycena polygramma]|nr:hypothetical protein DFH06DRAFT_1298954 [Mycena polygramma]
MGAYMGEGSLYACGGAGPPGPGGGDGYAGCAGRRGPHRYPAAAGAAADKARGRMAGHMAAAGAAMTVFAAEVVGAGEEEEAVVGWFAGASGGGLVLGVGGRTGSPAAARRRCDDSKLQEVDLSFKNALHMLAAKFGARRFLDSRGRTLDLDFQTDLDVDGAKEGNLLGHNTTIWVQLTILGAPRTIWKQHLSREHLPNSTMLDSTDYHQEVVDPHAKSLAKGRKIAASWC